MRLQDLQQVIALNNSLNTLNKGIEDVFYLKFDDNSRARFLDARLWPIQEEAKKALAAQLAEERNAVLQSLRRLGVTFNYE